MSSITQQTTEAMFAGFAAAWNGHDADAIAAFHTPDSTFTINALGVAAVGRDAVRDTIQTVLTLWPDVTFTERSLVTRDDLIVFESFMEGTLAVPLTAGTTTIEPNGTRAGVVLLDVVTVRDGLIASKDSHLDLLGYAQALGAI